MSDCENASRYIDRKRKKYECYEIDSRNMYRQLNKNMEYVLKNSIMCMLHTCTWAVA